MTIQDFKKLYFRQQLLIYNKYQQEYYIGDYIFTNNADTIKDLYGDDLERLLCDLNGKKYDYYDDYFVVTICGLESFNRNRAQKIIDDATEDILFKNYLEDYDY